MSADEGLPHAGDELTEQDAFGSFLLASGRDNPWSASGHAPRITVIG
jgi:hypothetical protein